MLIQHRRDVMSEEWGRTAMNGKLQSIFRHRLTQCRRDVISEDWEGETAMNRKLQSIFRRRLILFRFVCVCQCVWPQACRYLWSPEERVRSPGSGVTVLVSHSTWVLGIELSTSPKAASTLNLPGISPAPFSSEILFHCVCLTWDLLHVRPPISGPPC